MIQATTETLFYAYLSTEDNRINTTVASTQIKHLVKFINDMDGSVVYVYPSEIIFSRYTNMLFNYNISPDMFLAEVNLLPSGHWKYEVYEVSWIGTVVVALNTAPATEIDVLPVANTNGVVQGIVTKGILNLTEKTGTEQVQYTQHQEPEATNYVWYGEDNITWTPTDDASLESWYQNKVGVTFDGSNLVSVWLDSSTNTFNLKPDGLNPKPEYDSTTGAIIFSGDDPLKANSTHILTGEFTLGIRLKLTVGQSLGYIMGSIGLDQLELTDLKNINGFLYDTTSAFTLTSSLDLTDNSIVITRDSSNLISMTIDGVLQATTATAAGDLSFSTFGFDMNARYYEIQVYSSTSNELTYYVNDRLSNIIT